MIVLLDAPSNLGLRPPIPGSVPGCYKAPGALRDVGLLRRLAAVDGGVVTPPRYRAEWEPGGGTRNAAAIADYSRRLADRIAELRSNGFPVLLGGDCSILLGAGVALRRSGHYGLAFLDGHDDFRHPGNVPEVSAAAGEDLALATGRGAEDLTNIDRLRPYFRDEDVVVIGARKRESRDAAEAGIRTLPSEEIRDPDSVVATAREVLVRSDLDGFWIHVDVDVLDPSFVSAVDTPDAGGISPEALSGLLRGLVALPGAVGVEVTVLDPDLDPDGSQAEIIATVLEQALGGR